MCERARLQSCRKCHRIDVGLQPLRARIVDFAEDAAFFRSLFGPCPVCSRAFAPSLFIPSRTSFRAPEGAGARHPQRGSRPLKISLPQTRPSGPSLMHYPRTLSNIPDRPQPVIRSDRSAAKEVEGSAVTLRPSDQPPPTRHPIPGPCGVFQDLSGFRLWPVEVGGIPGPQVRGTGGTLICGLRSLQDWSHPPQAQ
jgi:hypothetical protein